MRRNPERELQSLVTALSYNIVDKEKYKQLFLENFTASDYAPPLMNFDDIIEELTYQESDLLYRPSLHIGQRKLFLTEMRFFVEHIPKDEQAVIVYAGAAPSNHTGLLSSFFPNLTFILVDPARFAVKNALPTNLFTRVDNGLNYSQSLEVLKRVNNGNKLYTINDYFTIELARALKDTFPSIYFISDIRTVTEGDDFANSLDILWNLSQQFNWISVMKPKMSMLKFRHPFYSEDPDFFRENAQLSPYKEDFEMSKEFGIDFVAKYEEKRLTYVDGMIQLQPWAPVISTETRLITNGKEFRDWGYLTDYENKFFYYNNIARCFRLRENTNADRRLGFDHCNDCSMENEIWLQYKEKYNKKISVKQCVRQLSGVSRALLSNESDHGFYFSQDTTRVLERVRSHNYIHKIGVAPSRRTQYLERRKETQ